MKFWNFMKSIFIPKYMHKRLNMPILISLIIFLIASYVIALPQSLYVSKHRYTILDEQNNYGFKIFELLDDTSINELKEMEINVVNTYLGYNQDKVVDSVPHIFTVEDDNKTNIHFYVVCDLYDDLSSNEEPHYNIDEEFATLKNTETDKYYLLVFYQTSLYFRTPELGLNFGYLKEIDIRFMEMEDGSYLSHKLMDFYLQQIKYTYTFYTFMECVLLPLLIALVAYFGCKKNGKLKTFKEYLNLGGLLTIPVSLLVFAFSWIYPNLMSYYLFGFGFYYLIILIFINSSKKVGI